MNAGKIRESCVRTRESADSVTKSSMYNLTPIYGFTSVIAPGCFLFVPLSSDDDEPTP